MTEHIEFDAAKVKRLRKEYDKAARNGDKSFTFEGNDYMTDYAKYMLQYLEEKFYISKHKLN